MKILRTIFRILVGLVFIFSGFVKGVDPMGTVFRMNDYFIAFGIPWAIPFSLALTIFLCTLEFTIGVSLFFNLWIKGTAWVLLAMMTYFTILTLFDALFNLVPDCGCFGDAVKLTNLQTFLKNIVLMAFVVPIFLWRKKFKGGVPVVPQVLVLLVFALAYGWMTIHAYRHLPIIDFMAWKEGKRINNVTTEPSKFYVTYKNKTTGEQKEFLAPNYPWNDSVWMSKWVFVSQRPADKGNDNAMVLRIEDESGNDLTADVLNIPDYSFILVSYDLKGFDVSLVKKINTIALSALEDGYSFTGLTNATPEDIRQFTEANRLQFPLYNADDVILKTMNRSNPGLILLNDGVVVKKWAWRDLPSYDEVVATFFSKKN
jgi:uncharacterized membrane protein YphA (DoxX/SURF4 family)